MIDDSNYFKWARRSQRLVHYRVMLYSVLKNGPNGRLRKTGRQESCVRILENQTGQEVIQNCLRSGSVVGLLTGEDRVPRLQSLPTQDTLHQ